MLALIPLESIQGITSKLKPYMCVELFRTPNSTAMAVTLFRVVISSIKDSRSLAGWTRDFSRAICIL
jgi:hypothetical protein